LNNTIDNTRSIPRDALRETDLDKLVNKVLDEFVIDKPVPAIRILHLDLVAMQPSLPFRLQQPPLVIGFQGSETSPHPHHAPRRLPIDGEPLLVSAATGALTKLSPSRVLECGMNESLVSSWMRNRVCEQALRLVFALVSDLGQPFVDFTPGLAYLNGLSMLVVCKPRLPIEGINPSCQRPLPDGPFDDLSDSDVRLKNGTLLELNKSPGRARLRRTE
jgi:hypothetical protein